MFKLTIIIILASSLLALSACGDTKPFLREGFGVKFGEENNRPDYPDVLTFYALGDWGTGNENQKAVARGLQMDVDELPIRAQRPFVLGVGDNVYENGLPEGWNNPEAIDLLHATFGDIYSQVRYQDEPLVFHVVPGNHDYAGLAGGKNGFGDIIHQETTAERLYDWWRYYPIDDARNSDTNDSTNYARLKAENILEVTVPQVVETGAQSRLSVFAIDTQVLLNLYDTDNKETLQKHWDRLQELVRSNPASWTFIIGHHPIRSHGKHGGFRKWWWYVPPIIVAALVDKFFYKRIQDQDHPAYRKFRQDLGKFMQEHQIDAYLAGHEHNLQFIALGEKRFQIISGSAGKLSDVTHDDDTLFSHTSFGFVRFDLTDEEMWVEFFSSGPDQEEAKSTGLFKIVR